MLKLMSKLLLVVSIITVSVACVDKSNETPNITKPVSEFIDKASGRPYQLVTEPIGTLAYFHDNGTITDIDNKTVKFAYIDIVGDNSSQAVYVNGVDNKEFMGIAVINEGSESTLDFYLDNNSNVASFWSSIDNVTLTEGKDAILATRKSMGTIDISFDSVTSDSTLVPKTGKALSTLMNGDIAYTLATDNKVLGSNATLFIGGTSTSWFGVQISVVDDNITDIVGSSLQLVGDDIVITAALDNGILTTLKYDVADNRTDIFGKDLGIVKGTDNVSAFAVDTDGTNIYIATTDKNNDTKFYTRNMNTQTDITLSDRFIVNSVVYRGSNDVAISGINSGAPIILSISDSSNTNITGTGLPTTNVNSIKLASYNNYLYAVVATTDKVSAYKYMLEGTSNYKWVEQSLSDLSTVLVDTVYTVSHDDILYILCTYNSVTKLSFRGYSILDNGDLKDMINNADNQGPDWTISGVIPGISPIVNGGLLFTYVTGISPSIQNSSFYIYSSPFPLP